MLIKYRMLPGITMQQFKDDISGLLEGTITTVNGLSAGCDKTNSSIVGSYPTGKYSRVNGTSYTYSKVHGSDASYTHYFRLTFDSTSLTTFTLARSYISGTDTLVNSAGYTVSVVPYSYSSVNGGLTIVIAAGCFSITSTFNKTAFGVFDLGTNGITTAYANNMKMAYINTVNGTCAMPYAYSFAGTASGYAALTGTVSSSTTPTVNLNASLAGVLPENPAFVSFQNQGYIAYGVNNLFKIPNCLPDYQYNTSGVVRQTGAGFAIVTE